LGGTFEESRKDRETAIKAGNTKRNGDVKRRGARCVRRKEDGREEEGCAHQIVIKTGILKKKNLSRDADSQTLDHSLTLGDQITKKERKRTVASASSFRMPATAKQKSAECNWRGGKGRKGKGKKNTWQSGDTTKLIRKESSQASPNKGV